MEAKMNNLTVWLEETRPEVLKEFFEKVLNKSGFGVLNKTEHYFEPQGYTCLWLLSESHLAIHTFPEAGKTYVELSSCVDKPYYEFVQRLTKAREKGKII